jgi:hypothetical protein
VTGALVLALAAGVAFRVWMIWSKVGTMDSDEAVWGLMALSTAHGHPATFFWRSNYGGTQEVFLLAPIFLVTGLSVVAMRVVQVLLYAAAAVLIWRVGRRTIGEPGARVAAVLFWVWPAYLVWRSTREYGFYGSALVLSLSSLLLVLRLYGRRTTRDLLLLGLTLGLGWWATPQCAFVAVPAALWLCVRRPRLLRDLPLVLGAAVVGALPWLVWNVRNHWLSFHALPAGNSYTDRLVEFFASTLPTILGLRVPWSLAWVTGELVGRALTVAVLGLVVWLAIRRREERLEPLLAVAIAFPFLYALSPYAWVVNEPRYLTLLAPIAALLIVAPLSHDGLRAAVLVGATALTLAALVSIHRHDLSRSYDDGRLIPADVQPALRALEQRHATRVLAPFWVAYRLTFASGRRVVATSTTITVRGRSDDRLVRSSPHPARVFVAGEPLERRRRASLLRAGFVRLVRGGFALYVWPRAASRGSS